jgi:hypothetical protein
MSNIINETFTKHLRLLRQHLKPALKLNEGKMKDLAIDLEDMSDAEFKKKHGKTKSELRALLGMNEGKMKDLAIDLEDMSDAEFKKKHGKTKSEIQALLDIEVNENDDNNILKGADISQSTDDGYDMRRDRRPMTPSVGRGWSQDGLVGSRRKTMYFYKVPSDKIEKAIDLGLHHTKSGKWFSPRKPNDIATKEFGSPKEWSPVDESQGSPMTPSGRGRFHIGSGYINKTMYIYKVPSDKIEKAIDLGLRQTKSGKWVSFRKPNDIATKEFGSPKEWSPVDESQGSYIARDEGYDYDSDDGYDSRRDARHSRDGYVDSGPSLGPAQQKRANRIALAALDRRSVGQLYFYTVPSDKETLAIRMGLRKSKSGRWFSPGKPNDVATKEFGSPKEWSLPKNEGSRTS